MSGPKIPLAGVIGHPIAHSRSPQLHGHWLQTHQIPGFYVPMDVAPQDIEQVLKTLPKAGFVGVNVTIPHKETVLHLAQKTSERARQIGAANTLTFGQDGEIFADNTDGYGFLANLQAGAPNWSADTGPALVIGAGGASRAVLVALLEAGTERVFLTNRTLDRAAQLRDRFGDRIEVVAWQDAHKTVADAALVVNTTSLGMVGNPELNMALDGLRVGTVVTDLVYAPLETRLLRDARQLGSTVVDGLGMLLHQGVPGFERWFGQRPAVTEETRSAVLA